MITHMLCTPGLHSIYPSNETLISYGFQEYHLSVQLSTDILWVLSWVQTVCKGYQQTTKVTSSKEIVNDPLMCTKPANRMALPGVTLKMLIWLFISLFIKKKTTLTLYCLARTSNTLLTLLMLCTLMRPFSLFYKKRKKSQSN